MPIPVLSTAQARAAFGANAQPPASTRKAEELRRMFGRFNDTSDWLKRNGHGGKIVLPMPASRTNGILAQCHWNTLKELKEAYWSQCDVLLMLKLIPPPPKVAPMRVQVETVFYVTRQNDHTNLTARRKWPEDWLVKQGYVLDDSPDHLVIDAKPEQTVVPRKEARVEFLITAL